MCRSGAYAPCTYPRICSNCASACFHILGFIPWPGPRAPPFAVIPAQAGIHCAAGILFVSPRNPSVFILSPRCPAPVFSFCHPAARAPRKRQFSRVDADRRIQVIYVVTHATPLLQQITLIHNYTNLILQITFIKTQKQKPAKIAHQHPRNKIINPIY